MLVCWRTCVYAHHATMRFYVCECVIDCVCIYVSCACLCECMVVCACACARACLCVRACACVRTQRRFKSCDSALRPLRSPPLHVVLFWNCCSHRCAKYTRADVTVCTKHTFLYAPQLQPPPPRSAAFCPSPLGALLGFPAGCAPIAPKLSFRAQIDQCGR
jgi:hypothetical protein